MPLGFLSVKKIDPAQVRADVLAVADWVRDPQQETRPERSALARAVRGSVRMLAQEAPGHAVELRVPPFAAVQCIDGPRHTRGTPPNVVETDPATWLRLAVGLADFDSAVAAGKVTSSGSRASDVAAHLPVVALGR
ncbi:hypothetical protein CATYP_08805 [Corynebacterium atypicum]|uniref:Bacterial SCP orthologue domain-containing protein n=1 Tax=Corynebacterium atypicum TaxID=191610 RepID=A0ABM5QPE1_9CORY|nr:hypothetical protein CATYP_08805 [Corynebacterium atypicum]